MIGDTWPIEPIAYEPTTPPAWPLANADALTDAIGNGQLDDDLSVIIDAINRRTPVIARERSQRARERLRVNDRVCFIDTAKPQYLRGATGEIHQFDEDLVVVCLDRPAGRFTSGHVRCSPELLERLESR